MLGAHLHLYFQQNNPRSVAAKDKFRELATEMFSLDPGLCPDNHGHEEPHETSCWLSGPGGLQSEYPQNSEGSSFTTGKISLYVTNQDFASVLSWALIHTGEDTLGESLDFILHPCFGCNFADHQMWSLHRGTRVPNNLYGIARSGGWAEEKPPLLDPLGPPAVLCPSFNVFTYSIHLVFDPTGSESLDSVNLFRAAFGSQFKEGIILPYEEPMSYNHSDNIFLASDLLYLAAPEIIPNIIAWTTSNMPFSSSSVFPVFSIFLHPNSLWAPFENRCDMAEHGFWMGEKFPIKDNFTSFTLDKRILPRITTLQDITLEGREVEANFILYIYSAPNNPWQKAAWNRFLTFLSQDLGIEREECMDDYPALEPDYQRLCMMQEVEQPYMEYSEVFTTTYSGVFIPGPQLKRVFKSLLLYGGKSTLGYSVDFQLVQLTGSPSLDYSSMRSFSYGQRWSLNTNIFQK